MSWITPKLDWANGYVPTYPDFNRIEGNIDYLKNEDAYFFGEKTFDSNITQIGGVCSLRETTITGNFLKISGTSPRLGFIEAGSSSKWTLMTDNNKLSIRENDTSDIRMLFSEGGGIEIYKPLQIGIAGNIGSEQLKIFKDSGQSATQYMNTATGSSSSNGLIVGVETSGDGIVFHRDSYPLKFGSNGLQIMKLETSKCLISTSSPLKESSLTIKDDLSGDRDGGAMLHLESTGTNGESSIKHSNSTTSSSSWFVGLNESSTYKWAYGTSFKDSDTKVQINQNGDLTVTGNINPTTTPTTGTWTTSQVIPRGRYSFSFVDISSGHFASITQNGKDIYSKTTNNLNPAGGSFDSDGKNTRLVMTTATGSFVSYWKF